MTAAQGGRALLRQRPPLRSRLRSAIRNGPSVRSWIVDANDGIIATAGVLEGFAGAGADDATLVTAAVLATIAAALSIGGAKWAEESAERESQLLLAAEEALQLERSPQEEIEELAAYYEAKGVAPALALEVARQLTAQDALGVQLETEHGISEIMSRAAPAWAGFSACIAFALGAAIPLLISVAVPGVLEAPAIFVAVVISLIITSIVGARSGRTTVWRTIVRTLSVGVGTLGVSYLVGLALF